VSAGGEIPGSRSPWRARLIAIARTLQRHPELAFGRPEVADDAQHPESRVAAGRGADVGAGEHRPHHRAQFVLQRGAAGGVARRRPARKRVNREDGPECFQPGEDIASMRQRTTAPPALDKCSSYSGNGSDHFLSHADAVAGSVSTSPLP